MLAEPVKRNSEFDRYTSFADLTGLAAIAVPAGFGPSGLPAGVTLVGPGFSEDAPVPFAAAMHQAAASGMGAAPAAPIAPPPAPAILEGYLPIVVVGAHLTGMPMNSELTGPGGHLVTATRTAGDYRPFALPDTQPPKPGLVRDPGFAGPGIAVEVWALPAAAFVAFVARIPAPLGVGKVELEDGSRITGFLAESHALTGAREITGLGSWRALRAQA